MRSSGLTVASILIVERFHSYVKLTLTSLRRSEIKPQLCYRAYTELCRFGDHRGETNMIDAAFAEGHVFAYKPCRCFV